VTVVELKALLELHTGPIPSRDVTPALIAAELLNRLDWEPIPGGPDKLVNTIKLRLLSLVDASGGDAEAVGKAKVILVRVAQCVNSPDLRFHGLVPPADPSVVFAIDEVDDETALWWRWQAASRAIRISAEKDSTMDDRRRRARMSDEQRDVEDRERMVSSMHHTMWTMIHKAEEMPRPPDWFQIDTPDQDLSALPPVEQMYMTNADPKLQWDRLLTETEFGHIHGAKISQLRSWYRHAVSADRQDLADEVERWYLEVRRRATPDPEPLFPASYT